MTNILTHVNKKYKTLPKISQTISNCKWFVYPIYAKKTKSMCNFNDLIDSHSISATFIFKVTSLSVV